MTVTIKGSQAGRAGALMTAWAPGSRPARVPPQPTIKPVPRPVRWPVRGAETGEFVIVAVAIAMAAIAVVSAVGLATHLLAAGWARRELGLTFPGLPRAPGEWWRVFSWNVRHLIAPLAAAGLVCLRGPRRGRVARCVEVLVALFVLEEVAVNVLYVGLVLGAYGRRAAWWLAPHGPAELASYASALAIWTQGLRRRLTPRLAIHAAAVSVVLLAVAAAIETALR